MATTLVVSTSSRRPSTITMRGGGGGSSWIVAVSRTRTAAARSSPTGRSGSSSSTSSTTITRRTFFSRGGGAGGNQQQQQQHHYHHHHSKRHQYQYENNKRSSGRGFFSSSSRNYSSSFPFHDDRDPGLRYTSTVSNPHEVDGPVGIPSRAEQLRRLQQQQRGQHHHHDDGDHDDGDDSGDDNVYDVLVVGGGATGAGIALDAATRKSQNGEGGRVLKVACVERGDFASETSSRSTKLIWAGLKYMGTAGAALLRPSKLLTQPVATLQEFVAEMKLVYHCHVERHYMTTTNAHLTYWVPIVVPFYSWIVPGPPPMGHALYSYFPILAPPTFQLYDALSHFSCPHAYIMTNPQRIQQAFPQLKQDGLKYCAVFYEAMHNDARTNLAIAMTAAQHGAHIANYVEVIQLLYDDDSENDNNNDHEENEKQEEHWNPTNSINKKCTGVVAVDRMTNQVFTIRAKKIIFAGGPFTDQLRIMEENSPPKLVLSQQDDDENETNHHHRKLRLRRSPTKPAVRGASGTHVVVSNNVIPSNMGLLNFNTSDGRFLFLLPWQGHTLIGTTDKQNGRSAETLHHPPVDEVDWILREASLYLKTPLKREDVLSAWRGWRPLATDPHHVVHNDDAQEEDGAAAAAAVSRDHVISENPRTGVIFIAGGKWTTWRQMAEDVVNRLVQDDAPCRTLNISLHGGLLEENGEQSNNNATKMTTKQVVQQLESLPLQVVQRYGQQHGIDLDIARHLVSTYGGRVWEVCALLDEENEEEANSKQHPERRKGDRGSSHRDGSRKNELGRRLLPGFPYIQAEVVYACREYACTVEDVLSRRTRLSFLNKQAALDALPLVAQLMSRELGWTNAVTLAQTQAARQYIDSYGGRVLGDVTNDAATRALSDRNDKQDTIHKVSVPDNNADDDNKGWLYRLTTAATSGLKMTSMQRHEQRQQHHHHAEEGEEDSDDEQKAA